MFQILAVTVLVLMCIYARLQRQAPSVINSDERRKITMTGTVVKWNAFIADGVFQKETF